MPPIADLTGGFPLRRHEHVAIFYRGREAAFNAMPFLAEGLRGKDLCVYLAPDDQQAEMLRRLRELSLDVDRHVGDGSFRLHHGLDSLQSLQEWTRAIFGEAERAAATSLRWLEDGLWPAPLGFPMHHFFEFHALLNYQVKQYPSFALCQYDLEKTSPHHLLNAIAVHRHLWVEGALVRDNPFYVPAEKFLPSSPAERKRGLRKLFQDVNFDVGRLLAALVGYARIR